MREEVSLRDQTSSIDQRPWWGRVRRWGPAFLAAVVVRLAYWAIVLPRWTPVSDADQYDKIARSLADGTGYGLQFPQIVHHPTAFRPPLLPLLLTPGHWLFGEALWPGRLLNVVLGSLVVVLAGVLATRVGGRRSGHLAALIVMFSPPLLANDTITLTEPLALLLGLAAILLLDEGRYLQTGLATGLLLLTRPNGYLVVAILALWAWRKVGPRAAVGLVTVAACVLAPWLVRNRVQLGTWRLNTSDGFTLAAIYAPPSQAAGFFTDPVLSPAFNNDEEVRLSQFNEGGWNALLTDRAIAGLRANPAYVPQVVLSNVPAFFELDPNAAIHAQRIDGRRLGLLPLTRPILHLTTVLGLVGLSRYWRDHCVRVIAAITAQYVVLSLLLVASPRLRAPFDLACAIGVSLLLGWLADRRRPGDRALAQRDHLGLRRGSGHLDGRPAEVTGILAVGVASGALIPLLPGGVPGAKDAGCVAEGGEAAGTGARGAADQHRAGQIG